MRVGFAPEGGNQHCYCFHLPSPANKRIISTTRSRPPTGRPLLCVLSRTSAIERAGPPTVLTMLELDLHSVVPALKAGGVIAYPTEAVWGLGCDPSNETAVMKLLALKQRPVEKGMILIAASPAQLEGWVQLDALPADRRQAVLDSWPGANTWIVPAGPRAPRWITGEHTGIAVRVSAHPLVQALCTAWGGPLVSTSANLAGQAPARSRDQLNPALLVLLDGLLDGATGGLAQPTRIRVAATGEVLRD